MVQENCYNWQFLHSQYNIIVFVRIIILISNDPWSSSECLVYVVINHYYTVVRWKSDMYEYHTFLVVWKAKVGSNMVQKPWQVYGFCACKYTLIWGQRILVGGYLGDIHHCTLQIFSYNLEYLENSKSVSLIFSVWFSLMQNPLNFVGPQFSIAIFYLLICRKCCCCFCQMFWVQLQNLLHTYQQVLQLWCSHMH